MQLFLALLGFVNIRGCHGSAQFAAPCVVAVAVTARGVSRPAEFGQEPAAADGVAAEIGEAEAKREH